MPTLLERWEVMDHGELTEIDDGILTVPGTIKMPLGTFPRRMTVLQLFGGRTVIWSAIALDEPEMARIEAMGRPAFLVVPSDHHRLDAKIWKDRYPALQVVTPPGARESVGEAVSVDFTSDPFGDPDLRFVTVPGMEQAESALIVRRAGGTTLVLNDIIGNLHHPHGVMQHIMGRLMGFGVSEPQIPRPVKPREVADRAALAAQLREWAALPDLKRIIVSHGDPIEAHPGEVLRTIADSLE